MAAVAPKKRLGQNFLKDNNIIKKIIDSAGNLSDAPLLEIGPGTGALTQHLINKSDCFVAVEFDSQAVDYLTDIFPPGLYPGFHLLHSDIRKSDLFEIFKTCLSKGKKLNVIGNIPYNISSDIIFFLIENRSIINTAQLMLQKEVAQRICSKSGNKTYGITTIAVNLTGHCEYLFDVSPNSFYPAPKVTSAVIKIVFDKLIKDNEYNEILKIVKTAFNQRRKQLRNSLKTYFNKYTNYRTEEFMRSFEEKKSNYFDKRPEHLTVDDFRNIYYELIKFNNEK